MLFIVYIFTLISAIYSFDDKQQIIEIVVNEELPLSTILFITNSNLTYRLFDSVRNQNSFVNYQSSSNHLILARSIDREQLCIDRICSCSHCQLLIELIEWQPPYRLLKFHLIIEDINDYSPTFPSDTYHYNVLENVGIDFELNLEQAEDNDFGENSRLNYVLQLLDDENLSKSPFELMKSNGALSLKVCENLDREQRDSYQYQLIAYDHGQPKRSGTTKLFIHIEDVNDNAVELNQSLIRLNLSENTPIGTILTIINATDRDIGLNGKIHYSISNGFPLSTWMDYFRLNESNGILTLMNFLDYESEQTYSLTIQIRDHGENSLTRFMTIDIDVLDENDNDPQAFVTFLHPYLNQSTIKITENIPIGQMLAHVSMSDSDSEKNGEISWAILQGQDLIGIHEIDQRSFLLIIRRSIDREIDAAKIDRLILIISDHGQPSRSIRLEYSIEIIDINDNPPRFQSLFECHKTILFPFNQSIDQPLMQIQAIDIDENLNGHVSYSILPPNDRYFTVNEQGEIFSRDLLNESSEYQFEIMAIDHGDTIRLNSTKICSISTLLANSSKVSSSSDDDFLIFPHLLNQYSSWTIIILVISILLLLIISAISIRYCLNYYDICSKENKTYHLYVTVPRQSSSMLNEETLPTDRLIEHQRLIDFHDDQKSSSSLMKDTSSISTTPTKTFVENIYRSSDSSTQESRPVSLSISTTTTCASCDTDSSFSPNGLKLTSSFIRSTVIRLAEEENSEI